VSEHQTSEITRPKIFASINVECFNCDLIASIRLNSQFQAQLNPYIILVNGWKPGVTILVDRPV